MRMRTKLFALSLLSVVFAPPIMAFAQSGKELVEKGYQIAREHCARCHVISDDKRMSGISSTASFPMMVNYLDDWELRFETFFARNPHPAHVRVDGSDPPSDWPTGTVPVEITADEVEAVLAYARSLRK
jgi:mono/diheme cytochrome c family protein